MGSEGKDTGESWTLTTGCPFRCGEKIHQLLTSWQRSDRITLRCVPGEHTAECEGEKGINRQPQAVTPPAGGYGQETKVHRKRRELEPAKAADRQAQTGIVPIRSWFSAPRASARCEGHGV